MIEEHVSELSSLTGEVEHSPPERSARRAMVFSFGQRYLAFVIQLGTSIFLARLLSPHETGIFSLAAAAVAVGAVLRQFGTSDYVVSEKHLSAEKLRAAYTVTVGFAWATAAVLFAAAYPLAHHYDEPGVANVMHVLCLNFLLVPLGSTSVALLTKALRFDTLFWIQTSSELVAAVVTVLCALNGLSYLSPAWGSVAGISTTVLLLFVRSPSAVFMLPGFGNLRQVLRFGGTLTLARIVESVANRSSDFIVSGMLGFHASGVLSKATSLNAGFYAFFASAIMSVATPVLAQARHGNRSVADGYRHALVVMASIQWMFFGTLAVAAPELIFVLFGDQWDEAVPVLQIGAFQGMLWAPFMLCTALLTAYGAVGTQLRINLVYGVVLVACLAVGALHSLLAAAALTVVANILRLALFSVAIKEVSGISTRSVIRVLGPSANVCAFGLTLGFSVRFLLVSVDYAPWIVLVGTGVAAVGGFLAAAVAIRHPLIAELRKALAAVSKVPSGPGT